MKRQVSLMLSNTFLESINKLILGDGVMHEVDYVDYATADIVCVGLLFFDNDLEDYSS